MSWSVGQRTRDKGEGERGALERREPELGGKHSQGEQVALDGLLTNDLNLSLTNQLAGRPTKLIVRYSRADIYWTRPSQFLLPIILNEPTRGYGLKRKAFKFYESG